LVSAAAVIAHVDFPKTHRVGKYGFVARTRQLLDSSATVIATVASRGEGFIAEVKQRKDCELWKLTRANRDAMPGNILAFIRAGCQRRA
jgi:nucleoside-triphosphatase THEP1